MARRRGVEGMSRDRRSQRRGAVLLGVALLFGLTLLPGNRTSAADAEPPSPLLRQTRGEANQKSQGCITCHVGIEPMHETGTVKLGCVDCHGGNVDVASGGASPGSPEYKAAMEKAHVHPRHPEKWASKSDPDRVSSANPVRR